MDFFSSVYYNLHQFFNIKLPTWVNNITHFNNSSVNNKLKKPKNLKNFSFKNPFILFVNTGNLNSICTFKTSSIFYTSLCLKMS